MTRRTAYRHHHRLSATQPIPSRSSRLAVVIATNSNSETENHCGFADRSRARLACMFFVFAAIVLVVSQAFAQAPGMKTEKMDEALMAKATVSAMDQARKEASSLKDLTGWAKMNAFDAYYKKYLAGKMKDDAFSSEAGAISQSMLDDLDKALRGKSPAAPMIHKYIVDLAKSVSSVNYHPAARINATMMLALINDAPEDTSTRKPPVPATDAFLPLVQLYTNASSPDAVKAVALQGIARHVSLGAVKSPQMRAGVVKLMRELVSSESPAARSATAHGFMQRYAVDILSTLVGPNTTPETTQTLIALSTSKDKPSIIAAYAASKCAAIKPGTQKPEKLRELLQNWAARAADTVDGEIARINTLSPPVPVTDQPAMPVEDSAAANAAGGRGGMDMAMGMESGRMSSMSMGGAGMGMETSRSMMGDRMGMMGMGMAQQAKAQPIEIIASRRKINHLLQQLQLGITGQVATGMPQKPAGLVSVADPADETAFETWINTVAEVVTAINVDTLDDRTKFLAELAVQSAVLRELSGVAVDPAAKQKGSAPAVAGPMEDFDPLGGPAPATPIAPIVPAVPAPGVAPVMPAVGAAAAAVVDEAVDELE